MFTFSTCLFFSSIHLLFSNISCSTWLTAKDYILLEFCLVSSIKLINYFKRLVRACKDNLYIEKGKSNVILSYGRHNPVVNYNGFSS